ncbi:MAG: hypothetical protein ACLS48_04025 [[Eubacterium] siraeum]
MESGAAPAESAPAAKQEASAAPAGSNVEGSMTVRVFFEDGCKMENSVLSSADKNKDVAEVISCTPPMLNPMRIRQRILSRTASL